MEERKKKQITSSSCITTESLNDMSAKPSELNNQIEPNKTKNCKG